MNEAAYSIRAMATCLDSINFSACINYDGPRILAWLTPPDCVLQVDARANMIGNNGDAVADPRGVQACADIHLPMLLIQSRDSGLGKFNNESVSAFGSWPAPVAGERLGAGVEHDLSGDGSAHNCADDASRTVRDSRRPAMHAVHVIKYISARPNLGEMGHQLGAECCRR